MRILQIDNVSFKNNNVSMVWSQMDRLQTPPIVTSDFVYLRLIGDRRLAENDFGKIQIDRSEEIKKWADKLKEKRQSEKDVRAAIVAANNHYGGYGPGIVDIFSFSSFGAISPIERTLEASCSRSIPDSNNLSD